MMLLGILPILFLIVILSLVVFAFKANKRKAFRVRKIKWVLSAYVIILLVATVLSYTIHPDMLIASTSISDKKFIEYDKTHNEFYETIENGTFNVDNPAFDKKEQWTFPYDKKSLRISVRAELDYNPVVLVEKKESNDGEIEAVHYLGKTIIDGVDMTDYVNSPKLRIDDDELAINAPDVSDVKMKKFSGGLAFDQFSGNSPFFSNDHYSVHGNDFVYLKVPQNVEVVGDFRTVNKK